MPPRNRRPTARELNKAARLTEQLRAAGYTKRDVARIIGRDPSLVSQFCTRGKGAAFVPALQHILQAVQTAGITDIDELATLAAPRITRRTTAAGTRARVRTKAVLITPTGTGTGRVAAAIASGSTRLRPLIAEAARRGLRLAFTVRMPKTGYIHPSGSRIDSPGIRRGVIQRADHTEERSYGLATTGGFDAADSPAEWTPPPATSPPPSSSGSWKPAASMKALKSLTWRSVPGALADGPHEGV